jgi:hypothetical protein
MIKDFPIDRYKFYVVPEHRMVVAVSTFAGKTYRGIAKCDPGDTWDEDYGKRLAAARCSVKIATKRIQYAEARGEDSRQWANEAVNYYIKDLAYMRESEDVLNKAIKALGEVYAEKAPLHVEAVHE